MAHVRRIPGAPPGAKEWECRWSYTDSAGKRVFQRERFRTRREAEQKKRDKENSTATGLSTDHNPGRQPLKDWAERWYTSLDGKKKPSTLRGYRSILNTDVLPYFGNRRIASVTPADVDEWLTHLRTVRAMAPPTIRRHYGVLRLVFKYAARLGGVGQNPTLNAELPTDRSTGRVKPSPVFLTAHEVEKLARELPEPYDLLVRFLAYTGLRVAECSGLNVGDIDLAARRQVTVARTRTRVKGGWEVHVTKSGKPRRVPMLPRWLRDDMATYLAIHPNRDNPAAPLFPGTTLSRTEGESGSHRSIDWSKPWEPGTFHKRQFKPALERAGLPRRTRMHDLRHTAASLMLAAEVEPIWVAEYLGHSLQMLTTVYAHLLPDVVDRHSQAFASARPSPAEASNVLQLHG